MTVRSCSVKGYDHLSINDIKDLLDEILDEDNKYTLVIENGVIEIS